jgi:hypothetical protein
MECDGEHLWRRNIMRTLSLVVVVMMVALGSFLSPVIGAEDHVMVTPDDLKWVDPPSLPPGAKLAVIQGPIDQTTPFIIQRSVQRLE